jgi:anti-anti-sigma factor
MSDVKKNGDKVVVRPDKDIVASITKDFKGELKGLLDGGAKQMAVDLEEVKMIDSSGLGVLIAAHNSLQKLGARLELLNVSDDIRKLLQNMRLDKHFTIQ